MPTEVSVALVGASATIISAILGALPAARRKRLGSAGHPLMAFFTILALGLAITALVFAYTATGGGSPSEVERTKDLHNTSRRAYFITMTCNSTGSREKQIELKIGDSPNHLELIVSATGGDRIAASGLVPAGSYYRIDALGATEGCKFKQWPL